MQAAPVLGVTGSIASGKSMVAGCLGEMGASVVSADAIAREVVEAGGAVLKQLVDLFGEEILDSAGSLARGRLAEVVFRDDAKRRQLNAVMHPAIAAVSAQRLREQRSGSAPLVIYEAPLLFEAGAETRVDQVLMVFIEPEIQLKRLCARDAISREAAQARIAAQWPQQKKISRADYVIDNSGTVEATRCHVRALYDYLTGTRQEH